MVSNKYGNSKCTNLGKYLDILFYLRPGYRFSWVAEGIKQLEANPSVAVISPSGGSDGILTITTHTLHTFSALSHSILCFSLLFLALSLSSLSLSLLSRSVTPLFLSSLLSLSPTTPTTHLHSITIIDRTTFAKQTHVSTRYFLLAKKKW